MHAPITNTGKMFIYNSNISLKNSIHAIKKQPTYICTFDVHYQSWYVLVCDSSHAPITNTAKKKKNSNSNISLKIVFMQ